MWSPAVHCNDKWHPTGGHFMRHCLWKTFVLEKRQWCFLHKKVIVLLFLFCFKRWVQNGLVLLHFITSRPVCAYLSFNTICNSRCLLWLCRQISICLWIYLSSRQNMHRKCAARCVTFYGCYILIIRFVLVYAVRATKFTCIPFSDWHIRASRCVSLSNMSFLYYCKFYYCIYTPL